MADMVEIPAWLVEAAAPAKQRRRGASTSVVTSVTTGRFVPMVTAGHAAQTADPGEIVSFTVAGTPATLDSKALTALVSMSLQHEATLHQVASRVGMSVDELIGALQRTVLEPSTSNFTDSEMSVLTAAHVDLAGPAEGAASVELAGRAAAHRLVAEALTIDEAADALAVTPGRVRQRLSAGELLHVRRADSPALIPRWQIRESRIVPGLKQLFAEAPELHPLAVARFMTAPHPDLELDDEAASPSDWLLTGGDVEPVVELLHSVALRG